MDGLTVIGIVVAFSAVIGGNYLEGGAWHLLINYPAAIIVLGGTVGAAILQTPKNILRRALILLIWVIKPPLLSQKKTIKQVVSWAEIARKRGLLGLDTIIASEKNIFIKKGLQMLVDGTCAAKIKQVLENDITLLKQRDNDAAGFFESMGGYAPTVGIIGAVIGLIHVMGHLGSPEELGPALAIAFVATLYGVSMANLICLPVANKLRAHVNRVAIWQQLLVDGISAIAEGDNPKAIEARLSGYCL
ncbi:flagellar motor protein [Marinagarivorans algicola]|uniref:flagellar motor protein n=1 Tax=Marinagarivorans algicola TaxID=1513270 RepID=UPI0006B5E3C2|nr:flagellar motor protein [Marinagarivorans algicola]